jgi:hypothetical protein
MFGRLACIALVISVAGPLHSVDAQTFEGILRQRTISVSLEALADRGYDVSEALFDVPVDELLSLRSEFEAMGAMTMTESDVLLRGMQLRMDASDEDGPGYVIVDLEAEVTRFVRPGEGAYIEVTAADMAQAASLSGGGSEEEGPEMMETGLTRTINGMRATAFDFESYDSFSRVWISTDDPGLVEAFRALEEGFATMSMGDPPDPSMIAAARGVPVLSQRLGYEFYSVEEVLSVERTSVAADLFDVPQGLERMTMQELWGGFMTSGEGEEAQGLMGMGGGEAPPAWIEYEVSGVRNASAREDGIMMCSESEDGFLARSLGDVIIGIEADGGGEGTHEAWLTLEDDGGRLRGRGTVTISVVGEDGFGFSIYEADFDGPSLESGSGNVAEVSGSFSCSALS